MQVPIKRGSERVLIDCDFVAEIPKETHVSWKSEIEDDEEVEMGLQSIEKMMDCLEYLECSHTKLKHYAQKNRVKVSIRSLKQSIKSNQNGEFAGLILASAPWYGHGSTLGLCFFRRTWCNHLAIDYLSTHPRFQRSHPELKGVGTALLYAAGEVAKGIKAPIIWAETTDFSVTYYRGLFETPKLQDLLIIDSEQFQTYLSRKIYQQK